MTERIEVNRPDTFVFSVPVITTLDEKLLQVLRDCPLQAIIIDDFHGVFETILLMKRSLVCA